MIRTADPDLEPFVSRSRFWDRFNPRALFGIMVCASLIVAGSLTLPSRFWDSIGERPMIGIGLIGAWRFSWWGVHVVRAIIYRRVVFPRRRAKADAAWNAGVRPRHLHFMVITFREHTRTITACIRSVLDEVRATGLPATIWLGSGEEGDEETVARLVQTEAADLNVNLVIARQRATGKRMAIGTALRAIATLGHLQPDDLVFFMDGDSAFLPGLVPKTTSLFLSDPKLQALTTDEEGVLYGPSWMASWLSMRFAQRRIGMQSHSLSRRVLTLTGRLSIIRARFATAPDFIRLVEEDHLDHWLWGRFRFLSGDDKSTWYFLLAARADMIFVPDAITVTIERFQGSGTERMLQNLRRWSGNMLRNGTRAIALGPGRVGPFIWWCLVDQRIAMWTTLAGPALALTGAVVSTPWFLGGYLLWLLLTRLIQASVLWAYSRKVDAAFVPLLYFNQVVNAAVKIACMTQLSRQRWTNRGDQRAGFEGGLLRRAMATYIIAVAMGGLLTLVLVYADRTIPPTIYTFMALLRRS